MSGYAAVDQTTCEIGAYRPGLLCWRWGQFFIAADPGLHACPTHLGQLIVAATIRSGRTSVVVRALTRGPKKPRTG